MHHDNKVQNRDDDGSERNPIFFQCSDALTHDRRTAFKSHASAFNQITSALLQTQKIFPTNIIGCSDRNNRNSEHDFLLQLLPIFCSRNIFGQVWSPTNIDSNNFRWLTKVPTSSASQPAEKTRQEPLLSVFSEQSDSVF